MTRKKCRGYVFVAYKGDHPPYHIHIQREGVEIGRWDIENQRPMDGFPLNKRLRDALKKMGYLLE
ncbi:MAG: hypothetical protein HYX92_04910 [Chloroflexi bacterium]|nr:hypothetical protein [Chloroflexota bacterium]